MSGTLYYLLKDPERMKLLTEEIRGSFETEHDITLDALGRLKYANACTYISKSV